EGVLRTPRRRLAPELLGDRTAAGRPELADLVLVAERRGPGQHPRGPADDTRRAGVQVAPRRGMGPPRIRRVSHAGQARAPMSGTNAHGVPSRRSRLPSGLRVATISTCPLRGPIGATMRPRDDSWR